MKPGVAYNYMGPTHNRSNLNRRKNNHLPMIFDNLSGFYVHLFFKDLSIDVKKFDQVSLLKRCGENYTHVSTWKLNFVDDIKYLPGSLSSMAQNLEL